MRHWRLLLIIIALVCFGVALSYPIRYRVAEESNNADMESLAAMHARVLSEVNGEAPDGSSGEANPENQITEKENEADRTAREDREQSGLADAGAAATASVGAQTGSGEASTEAGTPREEAGKRPDAPIGPAASEDQAQTGDEPPENPIPEDIGEAQNPSDTGESQSPSDTGESQSPTDIGESQSPSDTGEPQSPSDTGEAQNPSNTGEAQTPSDTGELQTPSEGGEAVQPGQADAQTGSPAGEPPTEEDAPERHSLLIRSTPTPLPTPEPTPSPAPTPTPRFEDMLLEFVPEGMDEHGLRGTKMPTPVPTVEPTPTPDRSIRKDALPYPAKEKVTLDRKKILPELQDIYLINQDLVGWLNIPDTIIDYPVVQCADREFYLDHDFYRKENINGQIILDTTCDAWTPSYNLIISGHHMKNGSMFGNLPLYTSKSYWEKHKIIHFDTLMTRSDYVVFAAFYSADYDEDEKGFRYSADIQYRLDAEMWLEEVWENQLYDTGVDARFGDEFITLTTCNRARHRNGRFVIVARKLREGETIE